MSENRTKKGQGFLMADRGSQLWRWIGWTGLAGWWKILYLVRKFLNHSYPINNNHVWPLLPTPKQYNLHIKGNKIWCGRRKRIWRKWRKTAGKKIQPTYLRISTRYDPCMPMMTSKKWDVVALLFKKTTVLKLSPTLSTQKMLLTFCFSHQQNFPSPKCPLFSFYLLCSHLLYSYPS